MAIKFKNNAQTKLYAGISAFDTVLTVTPGTGDRLPAITGGSIDYFVLTMEDAAGNREFIRCNVRALGADTLGNGTYPLVRGYYGSTARAWVAGDTVDIRWTAESMQEFLTSLNGRYLGESVGDPATDEYGNAVAQGDLYYKTGNQLMYYDGSTWIPAVNLAGFMPLSGGTMAGELLLAGTPTDPNGAVPKSYVVAKAGDTLTGALNEKQGNDIASATTVDLSGAAVGNYVQVTGTSSISAILIPQGGRRTVRFTGALTLVHSAALALPTGANISVAAGDIATFVGEGSSGAVRCVGYLRASGEPVGNAFPTGTRMVFQQLNAPTGWTKETNAAYNDAIMRVVTGTPATGGATAFSTFNAQTVTSGHALDITQIPAHSHTLYLYRYSSYTAGKSSNDLYGNSIAAPSINYGSIGSPAWQAAQASALGGAYNANNGGGLQHTHGLTHNIKYADYIIGQKQ